MRLALYFLLASVCLNAAQTRRKIIIDQDVSGPGGSNVQALMMLIQSTGVDVLGITVVSGDQWRDEEVQHTLRLLELLGRPDIPVLPGAVEPLVHRREQAKVWQMRFGKVAYAGAWDNRWYHESSFIPPLKEGQPSIRASSEDAAHFLTRMVHQYPGEITIYEGGPMTNLAVALIIDPEFAGLASELVFMGGSLNPLTDYEEFVNNPRHEFNFWFDPEAAFIVLQAQWKKVVCTPVDISVKAKFKPETVKRIEAAGTPLTQYVAKYFVTGGGSDFMWDEIAAAAWLDAGVITQKETRYMSVEIDHNGSYGNTLTWLDSDKPDVPVRPVEIQLDLDTTKFFDMFVSLLTRPSPAH